MIKYRSIKKDWTKIDKMTDLEKAIYLYFIKKYNIF